MQTNGSYTFNFTILDVAGLLNLEVRHRGRKPAEPDQRHHLPPPEKNGGSGRGYLPPDTVLPDVFPEPGDFIPAAGILSPGRPGHQRRRPEIPGRDPLKLHQRRTSPHHSCPAEKAGDHLCPYAPGAAAGDRLYGRTDQQPDSGISRRLLYHPAGNDCLRAADPGQRHLPPAGYACPCTEIVFHSFFVQLLLHECSHLYDILQTKYQVYPDQEEQHA